MVGVMLKCCIYETLSSIVLQTSKPLQFLLNFQLWVTRSSAQGLTLTLCSESYLAALENGKCLLLIIMLWLSILDLSFRSSFLSLTEFLNVIFSLHHLQI